MNDVVGVVVGKFYPPHKGHQALIEYALANCDRLYTFVVDAEFEKPNGKTRLNWLSSLYPEAHWGIIRNVQGQENNSVFWAELTMVALKVQHNYDGPVERVFTSEGYGDPWAKALGATHWSFNPTRSIHTISGTECRAKPVTNFSYLSDPAKLYYARRFCVVGPESCGKTTLVKRLANHFNTVWTPEVGRLYVETFGIRQEDPHIWHSILGTQPKFEDHMVLASNGIVFADTDLLTTVVWHKRWSKARVSHIRDMLEDYWLTTAYDRWNDEPYAHYLLLSPTVDWVQDGTRTEGEDLVREWFFDEICSLLDKHSQSYTVIDASSFEERTERAMSIVSERVIEL